MANTTLQHLDALPARTPADVVDVVAAMHAARRLTDELFACVRPGALRQRPVPERHRLLFYLGHLEAFDWNLLAPRSGLLPFRPGFDRLFAFGIDPARGALPDEPPDAWPPEEEIRRYVGELRGRLDQRLPDLGPAARAPRRQLLEVALEHRLMHAETLAWLIARLPEEDKLPPPHAEPADGRQPEPEEARIPAGLATLGRPRAGAGFGWDNEHEACRLPVAEFGIDVHDVTNGGFLRFIESGGYDDPRAWSDEGWAWRRATGAEHPSGWRRDGDGWRLSTMWSSRPLPLAWPVSVSQFEADAFARWAGRRLPTEAEFHRAAWGTPTAEREHPWGEAPPDASRGRFDFHGWDPLPVGSHPAGRSAFGVHDLLGNGWEWTSSPFAPLPGFRPFAFYPGYSRDFFDGQHVVVKGGSPRTAARLLRRSFRNWLRPGTTFGFTSFRTVGP